MIGRLGERQKVADRVLLRPERAAGHPPGGVVDAGHQGGERQLRAEPAMPAAVDLEELALAGHPLAAAAVAGRTAGADRTDVRLGQDPAEGPLRDVEALAFGEQLGQVGVVDPGIRRRGELDDPLPDRVGDAVAGARSRLPWTRPAEPSAR